MVFKPIGKEVAVFPSRFRLSSISSRGFARSRSISPRSRSEVFLWYPSLLTEIAPPVAWVRQTQLSCGETWFESFFFLSLLLGSQ